MPDAYGTEYQDPFSAINKGLQTGMEIQNQKKAMLLKQAQAAYERSKSSVDLGFKALGEAKNKGSKQQIWNAIIRPHLGVVTGTPTPGIDALDDPTESAIESLRLLHAQGGYKAVAEGMPGILAQVSSQSGGNKDALSAVQSAASNLIDTQIKVNAQSQGTGTPQEFNVTGADGKTRSVLGRPTPEGEIDPITGVKGENVELKPEKLSAESAAKASSAQSSIKDVQQVRDLLFPDGKTLDRRAVLTGKLSIPLSKGREANRLMKRALETKIRNDSGAAVPESERKQILQDFGIELGDSDKFALEKVNRYQDIMENFLFQMDPNGKLGLVPREGNERQTPSSSKSKIQIKNLKITPSSGSVRG